MGEPFYLYTYLSPTSFNLTIECGYDSIKVHRNVLEQSSTLSIYLKEHNEGIKIKNFLPKEYTDKELLNYIFAILYRQLFNYKNKLDIYKMLVLADILHFDAFFYDFIYNISANIENNSYMNALNQAIYTDHPSIIGQLCNQNRIAFHIREKLYQSKYLPLTTIPYLFCPNKIVFSIQKCQNPIFYYSIQLKDFKLRNIVRIFYIDKKLYWIVIDLSFHNNKTDFKYYFKWNDLVFTCFTDYWKKFGQFRVKIEDKDNIISKIDEIDKYNEKYLHLKEIIKIKNIYNYYSLKKFIKLILKIN